MATIVESDPAKQFLLADGYAASSESEDESTPLSSQVNNEVSIVERVKHHAKRPSKLPSNNQAASPTDTSPTSDVNIKKFMKNSRRSRTRFGRGLTKKGNSRNLYISQ